MTHAKLPAVAKAVASLFTLLIALAAQAEPLPITTLHSTGFDASGQRLLAGADPHYTLLRIDSTASWDGTITMPPAVGANYFVYDPPINPQVVQNPVTWAWVQNTDASSWLSLEASSGSSQYYQGIYTYQTTFDLTDLDPATVRISGIWGTDDPGWIFVNLDDPTVFDPARLVVNGGGFTALPEFEITGANGLFRPGLNTLTFVVWDGGNCVTGLRFEVQSATAEPAILQIAVDVMPGTSPNVVTVSAQGELPVALVSAAGFDATQVIPATITVANAHVVRKKDGSYKAAPQDVNGDGVLDLVVKVATQDLGIALGPTQLVVDGFLPDGQHVRGSDAAVLVAAQ